MFYEKFYEKFYIYRLSGNFANQLNASTEKKTVKTYINRNLNILQWVFAHLKSSFPIS